MMSAGSREIRGCHSRPLPEGDVTSVQLASATGTARPLMANSEAVHNGKNSQNDDVANTILYAYTIQNVLLIMHALFLIIIPG